MRRSLPERWERIKPGFTLFDLTMDSLGKFLVALGLGILLAHWIADAIIAAFLIGAGAAITWAIKAKHWKRFWS